MLRVTHDEDYDRWRNEELRRQRDRQQMIADLRAKLDFWRMVSFALAVACFILVCGLFGLD